MDKKIETLHKLCEALMEELDEYARKIEKADGMNAGDLEAVDKLSHAVKSIKTTIAMMEAEEDEEGGYSGRYMPYYGGMGGRTYADGRMDGGRSYADGGMSYARGDNRGRGRNAKRDSMGRYSREGGSYRGYSYADDMESIKEEMRELAQQMPEEHRRKIERAIDGLM